MWIHASLQLFAYAFAIAGMGIGVWLAVTGQEVRESFLLAARNNPTFEVELSRCRKADTIHSS